MIHEYSIDSIPQAAWDKITGENTLLAIFGSYRWHRLWYELFGSGFTSRIWVYNQSMIAPFVQSGDTLTFSGGKEIADYLDIIGPDEQKKTSWEEILVYCQSIDITHIMLPNVPSSSGTVQFFQRHAAPSLSITIKKEDTTPILLLPATWEAYEASLPRHSRHELRRKLRSFERLHPDSSILKSTNPTQDMELFLKLMELDARKKRFLTEQMKKFFQRLPNEFPDELSLVFLRVGGIEVSGIITLQNGNSLFQYNSGYIKASYPGSGFYLTAKSIQQAIQQGLTTYNFLQGNEQYKYDLGAVDFAVCTIEVHFK